MRISRLAGQIIRSKDSPMNKGVFGVHHVTAITSDPQRNVDFYANTLGLRFVKLTVNHDDPTSYHLYYGDEIGHPGTFLLFFIGQIYQEGIEEQVKYQQYRFLSLRIQ